VIIFINKTSNQMVPLILCQATIIQISFHKRNLGNSNPTHSKVTITEPNKTTNDILDEGWETIYSSRTLKVACCDMW